jgi:hypothetical protein
MGDVPKSHGVDKRSERKMTDYTANNLPILMNFGMYTAEG